MHVLRCVRLDEQTASKLESPRPENRLLFSDELGVFVRDRGDEYLNYPIFKLNFISWSGYENLAKDLNFEPTFASAFPIGAKSRIRRTNSRIYYTVDILWSADYDYRSHIDANLTSKNPVVRGVFNLPFLKFGKMRFIRKPLKVGEW